MQVLHTNIMVVLGVDLVDFQQDNKMNYTIELTKTEDMALAYAAASQQDWIDMLCLDVT